jgi:hypothetical protein
VQRKVCSVTGLDSRGLPASVLVEAASLFEAAAAGLEELHKKGCLLTEVQILVHEPGKRYTVHPRQLETWLRAYSREDNVGIHALKTRVRGILNHHPLK